MKHTHFYTSFEKFRPDFERINKLIKEDLTKKSLIRDGNLTLKGALISKYYIFPSNFEMFEKFIEKYKEKTDNFWLLFNALPILLKGNYYLPDFYPDYYLNEIKEEIIEVNDKLPLILYALNYFAEYVDLEVKEINNQIVYSIQKLKPPTWVVNLNNDIKWITDFIKSITRARIIDFDLKEEDLERIRYSFILGIHPYFVKLGLIKNIGYNRAYLIMNAAKELGFKKDDEIIDYIKKEKNWKKDFVEIWPEVKKKLKSKYEDKLRLIVKEKAKINILTEKVIKALDQFLKGEEKEYFRALDILEKELSYV